MKNKKVALVTGGARGIGFGISTELAKEGFDLAICGRKEIHEIKSQLKELENLGAQVLYCPCDVSSPDQRADMLAEIKKKFGRINVLVNNAGVAPKIRKDILEVPEENFEWILKINLQGPFFLSQAVANWMVEIKTADKNFEGCIINISSISASVASVNRGEYCISKAGLHMMTLLFAVRLGEYNIPVYEIQPGVIKTDMTAGVAEKYDKLFAEGLAVQSRWGSSEDVGKAAAALAKGYFPYSTGQVIMVDGGLTVGRL